MIKYNFIYTKLLTIKHIKKYSNIFNLAYINNMWNVAIIGCGKISFGRNIYNNAYSFNHFDIVNSHLSFKITCVSDYRDEVLAKLNKYKEIKKYKNYKNLLKFNKIDLVIIATNSENHLNIIKEVNKKKIKTALVEKPLSNNIRELSSLVSLKSEIKTKIIVNYQRRFSNFFKKNKKNITKKSIIKIKVNYSRGLFNNGSHFIDLFIWYFGLPLKIIKKKKILQIKNDFICNFILDYNGFKIQFNGNNKKKFGNSFSIALKKRLIIYEKNLIKIYKKNLKNGKKILVEKYDDSDNIIEVYNYLNLLLKNNVALKSSINDSIKIHKVVKALI